MVVTMPKAWSGISLLKRAPAEMTSVDTNNPLLGTWFLFSFANLDGPWSFLLKLYKIRLVENIPLLQAEAAEVNTTKLIIPAASGIPTKLKVLTNGLSAAFNSIHGLINKRTISAPTQKNKIRSGILLMADGIFFWGFDVSAADTPTNSTPTYANITIWNESKKPETPFGNSPP